MAGEIGRDVRLARLTAQRHGVITRDQARDVGFSDCAIKRLVRSGDWIRIYPRVFRMKVVQDPWRSLLIGAVAWGNRAAWISHRSAAALWTIEGFTAGSVEISATANLRHPRVRVHHISEMPSCDVRARDGISVTDPTRTLIDVASVVSRPQLETAVLDGLRRGLTTVARLRSRVDGLSARGARGPARLRSLIDEWGDKGVPTTRLESRLYRVLRRHRLVPFEAQFNISDRGRFIARVDAAYPEEKVAIEADGYRWHSSSEQWKSDLARRNALTARGWQVLHFTWEDLTYRSEQVAAQIRLALNR